MPINNRWIKVGALTAALAVVLGAFAAHGLQGFLAEKYAGQTKELFGEQVPAAAKYLGDFKTAAQYQMTHALAIIAVGVLKTLRPRRSLDYAAWCFLMGVVFFSGSLYALVLTGVTRLGMVTPIGGLLMIAGWIALVEGACLGKKPAVGAVSDGD